VKLPGNSCISSKQHPGACLMLITSPCRHCKLAKHAPLQAMERWAGHATPTGTARFAAGGLGFKVAPGHFRSHAIKYTGGGRPSVAEGDAVGVAWLPGMSTYWGSLRGCLGLGIRRGGLRSLKERSKRREPAKLSCSSVTHSDLFICAVRPGCESS
jgi:hypothetical protein